MSSRSKNIGGLRRRFAEATSKPRTSGSMLNFAQDRGRRTLEVERNDHRLAAYQSKAWEYAVRAQSVSDPERRADMLRFAGMWMSLTEPIGDFRSPYEM